MDPLGHSNSDTVNLSTEEKIGGLVVDEMSRSADHKPQNKSPSHIPSKHESSGELTNISIKTEDIGPPAGNKFSGGADPTSQNILTDAENPVNMPLWRKWVMTLLIAFMTIWVTFSSSVFSQAIRATAAEFHVSTEVMTLGVSLVVFVCVSVWRAVIYIDIY